MQKANTHPRTGTRMLGLALVLILGSAPTTHSYPSDSVISSVLEIQERLYNDRFVEADSLARSLIRGNPHDPAGHLFRSVVLITEMFDAEQELASELFMDLLDSVEVTARRHLDTCDLKAAAWMHLYLGHAHAYRSLWESRFGSNLAALKQGRAARSEYGRGLAADSGLYDLYFGLGLYHYWKSAKAGLLRWLGIVKNDKAKGISQLRLAADSSIISRQAARSALIWIWLDRKQYDSVIALAAAMAVRYPEGKTFLWPLAHAHLSQHAYRKAAEVLTELRERIAVRPGNYYNLIESDFHLYRCLDRLGREDDANRLLREASEYLAEVPAETRRRQRTKFSFLARRGRALSQE